MFLWFLDDNDERMFHVLSVRMIVDRPIARVSVWIVVLKRRMMYCDLNASNRIRFLL